MNFFKTWKKNNRERGAVAIMGAVGMVSFVLAAGLAVDIGHLYLAGSELQNAADASAIAAASVLNGDASGITAAVQAAQATQNKFEFGKQTASFANSNVMFAKNVGGTLYTEAEARTIANQIRFVQVLIPNKPIPVPFAQVALGASTQNVSRKSLAGFSAGLQVLCDSIVPLSALQDPITQAPLDVVGTCANTYQFTPGCTYIIRRGSNGGGSGKKSSTGFVSPGNYLILALGASRGGNDARAGVAGSVAGCYKPGDCVGTQTGIEAGPIGQGLDTRFGYYNGSGLTPEVFPPDVNVKEGITYTQYLEQLDLKTRGLQPNEGHFDAPHEGVGRVGRRIIVIPIINVNQFDNGSGTVCISHFAAFFMQKRQSGSGDITAEYITTKVQVTDGYFAGGSDQNNQFSMPVLYK